MTLRNLVLLIGASFSLLAQASDEIRLDHFTQESVDVPSPWQLIQLNKKVPPTHYRVTRWDDVLAIEATAERSMTLLARPVEIDLNRTPVLCWRWRVDAPLVTADMATKEGDDYAARVYVSFAMPASALSFATRVKLKLARSIYGDAVPDAAINYVWDNRYPVGTRKPNAYTDRIHMIVAELGATNAGKWIVARHDVQKDMVTEFGSEQAHLVMLSVASDTDNTGEHAHAGFADFQFVEKDAACFAEHVAVKS